MSLADAYDIQKDMIYDSYQKRKNAVDMMVQIMKIQLPDELLRTVSQFLFYDISSNIYNEKRQVQYYKSIMRCVIEEFKQCRYFERQYTNFHNVSFRVFGHNTLFNSPFKHFFLSMCTRCGCYRDQDRFPIGCFCLT
jgi:hypothetical protein